VVQFTETVLSTAKVLAAWEKSTQIGGAVSKPRGTNAVYMKRLMHSAVQGLIRGEQGCAAVGIERFAEQK